MKHLLILVFFCLPLSLLAQLNTTLLGRLDFEPPLNDVWGYTGADGAEYALVGTREGTAIVEVTDPSKPTELFFIKGDYSVWRDIKTWNDFAYVTTDGSSVQDGLLVIDLSDLPQSAPYINYTPYLESFEDTLYNCHNLYIDEFGVAYLAGCNVNNGGVIAFDVAANSWAPPMLGPMEPFYSHDAFARDQVLYSANINDGFFSVINVLDKEEPILLATQETPFAFTHNVWLSDDGFTLYTTDERRNAPVAAYDISELGDIRLLDAFRPEATLYRGVIPHNVHVLDEFLVISYYTDGCVVVDGSRPHNLVEVANYDTWPGNDGGFKGAWGAYPYLPSGHVLISDIDSGLFILNIDYQRASFLEGTIVNAEDESPLSQASVRFLNQPEKLVETTDLGGDFATGMAKPGSYLVEFSKPGFLAKREQVELVAGEVLDLQIALAPKPVHQVVISLQAEEDLRPLPFAKVALQSADFRIEAQADENGLVLLEEVFADYYQLFAGKWGFQSQVDELVVDGQTAKIVVLEKGYANFSELDLEWTVSGDAGSGTWERGVPIPTYTGSGRISNPGTDGPDAGTFAWVTKNELGDASVGEVDRGYTYLTSPDLDLSDYLRPALTFDYWYYNAWSNIAPNDTLFVWLTNGTDTIGLDTITQSVETWTPRSPISLSNHFDPTETVRLIFQVGDEQATSHTLEAGIDQVRIQETLDLAEVAIELPEIWATAFPIPAEDQVSISYNLQGSRQGVMDLFSGSGQLIESRPLPFSGGTERINLASFPAGVYWVRFRAENQALGSLKIIRN